MPGITIDGLNKSYGSLHVLRDINLDVRERDFLVLLGPSGCGKSTLLNAIAGLDDIDAGRIRIKDRDVSKLEPSDRGIAMVFQSYALYPTMTVRRNLSFGLRVAGMAKPEIEERVAWAANLLRLDGLLDRRPSALSGGQRQRVAIGRALVRKSGVYLFDEPLSNLDAKLRTEMRIELKKLHGQLGCTIVYVTHDQIEAMTLATRIAVMNNGVIEQCADPANLYDRPSTLFVAGFVGSPAMNFLRGRLQLSGAGSIAEVGHLKVPLDSYAFAEIPREQDIVFGVRPEDVHLDPPAYASPPLNGTLAFADPMGADTLCWFDVGSQVLLSARVEPARARSLAGQHQLYFDMDRVSLFSTNTERRL